MGFLGFGSDPATQTAHNELLEFLSDEWRMKVRYATAFLNVYRDSIAKIHKDVTKRRGRMERNGNAELRLAMVAMSGKKDALSHVLIAQAYNAYMGDLKRGKHVGTDVELAIWAILANRSDILDYVDERFGKWIRDNYERRFPQLFEQVFSS